ncbi:hypothetical protein QQF64_028219 [Cirrhinus molitorella]|uniref:G-protein coupled receptors family 1 profile domain-containing protein n=1 Tax=Cirrhinus molitorella TaxID=172907 RepID=A0ABR3N5Z6_9TELE
MGLEAYLGIQPHAELVGQEGRGGNWDSADLDNDGTTGDPEVVAEAERKSNVVFIPEGRESLEESQYREAKVETKERRAKGLRGRGGDMGLEAYLGIQPHAALNTPLILAGMAVERYVAICKPLHHHQICTVRRTYILISLIWACRSNNLSYMNTPLTLAGVPVERYIAFCKPLHHHQICTVRRTYILISLM